MPDKTNQHSGGEIEAGRAAMPQHTPGPWTIPDGGKTAMICGADRCIATMDDFGDQAEVDARLIAAAPQMLAALYAALNWVEGQAYGGTAHVDASRAIRAAIAAAEGRA